MSHVTYCVACVNESRIVRHVWMSHVEVEYCVACVNESRDSFKHATQYVTWLIHSHVPHNTPLLRDSFTHTTQYVTHSHNTWLIRTIRDSFTQYVTHSHNTWLIHTCHTILHFCVTHAQMRHNTWLIHTIRDPFTHATQFWHNSAVSHVWRSHVTFMNQSRHTLVRITSRIYVCYTDLIRLTCACIVSHVWTSHVKYMNTSRNTHRKKSRHSREHVTQHTGIHDFTKKKLCGTHLIGLTSACIVSHMWMRHVTCDFTNMCVVCWPYRFHLRMHHVAHVNESRHIYVNASRHLTHLWWWFLRIYSCGADPILNYTCIVSHMWVMSHECIMSHVAET